MVKITVAEDCGNSPKRIFLKDLLIAFAEGDIPFITAHVTDDIVWHMVGDKQITGKDEFVEALHKMNSDQTAELIIHTIITHGREGSANGEIMMNDGKKYSFADVYAFSSAKGNSIKSITSYNIEVKE